MLHAMLVALQETGMDPATAKNNLSLLGAGIGIGLTVIGAGIALLTAPQPGRRTRRRLKRGARELRDTATDRWEDLADDMKGKVDEAIQGARKRIVS